MILDKENKNSKKIRFIIGNIYHDKISELGVSKITNNQYNERDKLF